MRIFGLFAHMRGAIYFLGCSSRIARSFESLRNKLLSTTIKGEVPMKLHGLGTCLQALCVLVAASASAQVTFHGARHCGNATLDWSSDLGGDYGDNLNPACPSAPFLTGNTHIAQTSRNFGDPYCSSRSVVRTMPSGPLTGAAPVSTTMYSGYVTTNAQRFNCGNGWAYGLFAGSYQESVFSFDTSSQVYWVMRVRWVNTGRTGCLAGGQWSLRTPNGTEHTGGSINTRGQMEFSGVRSNTSQLTYAFSASAGVGAAGTYGSPGWQGDTAHNQVTLEIFVSATPFTPPPAAPDATPHTDGGADRNGNGIGDGREIGAVSQTSDQSQGFVRASVGGNASAPANITSNGYRACDDFTVVIDPADSGKIVNELRFRTAETPASNAYGEFVWDGSVNVALFRDGGGTGLPLLENGTDPYAEFDFTNVDQTIVTRTPLGTSINFNQNRGGLVGVVDVYEYRIFNPSGLFFIPATQVGPVKWWIAMRPSSASSTSGVALVRRAALPVGATPGVRYMPDPPSGTPDYSFTTFPIDACAFSPAFECPGGFFGTAANDLYIDMRFGIDQNANGTPDDTEDCNQNGIDDFTDLSLGTSTDTNLDFVPDECQASCPADFNQDGGIDGSDVEAFFSAWESGDPIADVNDDGGIDGSDVGRFFEAWDAGGC